MQFSCKITHAILTHLESEKVDLSAYFTEDDFPWEKLRDPSVWMRAPDMEAFLDRIVNKLPDIVQAGHNTPKNKVWGVLDSVLRMMPEPQEIFHQPEKFLGYFISPEPPIDNLERHSTGVSFDIPLPAEQYPLVTTYLKAAFEALPLYIGGQIGTCSWNFLHLSLDWPAVQSSILEESEPRQVSRQLLQDVIAELQKSSQELEEKNRELQRRNEELSQMNQNQIREDRQLKAGDFELDFLLKPTHQIAQNLSKLHDYMVRAHQLVTILTVNQKQTPGVKQAFHKVDWDIVKQQYPQIIYESLETLKKLKHTDKNTEK